MELSPILLISLGGMAGLMSAFGVRMIRRYATQRAELASLRFPLPRGGGLAILTVVLLIFMPIGFAFGDPGLVVRFAMAGAVIAAIGFFDDLRTLPRSIRLLAQGLAAMIFLPATPITSVYLPRLEIVFSETAGYVIGLLWVVGLCNVYSYMDGIRGLSSGHGALAGALWATVGMASGRPLVALLGILIAGASLGFTLYNIPPNTVVMGDAGSAFLGFSLASLPLLAIAQGESSRLLVSGGLIVGLFTFDAALTFFRYLITGRDRSGDQRSHLYQRLIELGDPPSSITLLYLVISTAFGIAGLIYWREATLIALLLFTLVCVALFLWITQREAQRRKTH